MKKLIYTISALVFLIIAGCGNTNDQGHDHDHEHDHATGHDHPEEESEQDNTEEEVHLLQKQMDVMGIETGGFQFLNLSTTIKANGQLELPPQNKASVSAVMAGRVKSIKVLQGDYVKKGEVLAYLEHPDFVELQEQYISAKSQLDFLSKDFERKKGLYSDSISSAKSTQQSEAAYLTAAAKVNGLKARLQMLDIDINSIEKGNFQSSIPVRSPINGYVRLIEINVGKFVQPQQEMFEIVDNEHIHIDLMVYEKDLNAVKEGQKVMFSISNNPDRVYEGNIFAVGKSFEQTPKAMLVHAEINNKTGNLLPGMYVDARIVTDEKKVQSLPDDAIVHDAGLDYIFILKEKKEEEHSHEDGQHDHDLSTEHAGEYVFRKVEVNTGASDIGFTEVVPADHLPEKVQVVTKGAFYLLAEMKKGEEGSGHHH